MTRVKRILITAVLAATSAAIAAIAVSQAASSTPVRASGHARSSTMGLRYFSVLHSARVATSSEELPASTAKHLSEPGTEDSEYGLEPADARHVQLNASTHGWVVPGQAGVCLVVPSSNGDWISTDCGSVGSANVGGLVMVARPASGPVLYGLVPNGASVTVTNTNGSDASIPVADNVFMYADPNVQSVSVRAAGASVVTTSVDKG